MYCISKAARLTLGFCIVPVVAIVMIGCQEDNNSSMKKLAPEESGAPVAAKAGAPIKQANNYKDYAAQQTAKGSGGQSRSSGYPGAK